GRGGVQRRVDVRIREAGDVVVRIAVLAYGHRVVGGEVVAVRVVRVRRGALADGVDHQLVRAAGLGVVPLVDADLLRDQLDPDLHVLRGQGVQGGDVVGPAGGAGDGHRDPHIALGVDAVGAEAVPGLLEDPRRFL